MALLTDPGRLPALRLRTLASGKGSTNGYSHDQTAHVGRRIHCVAPAATRTRLSGGRQRRRVRTKRSTRVRGGISNQTSVAPSCGYSQGMARLCHLAKRSKRGLASGCARCADNASGRDPPPDQRSEVDAEASPPGVDIGPRVALPGAPIRFLRKRIHLDDAPRRESISGYPNK